MALSSPSNTSDSLASHQNDTDTDEVLVIVCRIVQLVSRDAAVAGHQYLVEPIGRDDQHVPRMQFEDDRILIKMHAIAYACYGYVLGVCDMKSRATAIAG